MNKGDMPENHSFFNKLFECAFAVVILSAAAFMTLPVRFLISRYSPAATTNFIVVVWISGILLGILFSVYWQKREKKPAFNSEKIHYWLQGIIRFSLANIISLYGFAKIFQTQFAPSYFRDDIPVGKLTGFQLTWNYFGHSYTMAVIIAALQIGGAILLLFRRTMLLGTFSLLPVMLNIVLINQFYDISDGAFMMAVIITIGLSYLLLLRWKDLKILLFSKVNTPALIRSRLIKIVLKLLAIGLAYATIQSYLPFKITTPFEGKWRVDTLISNHHLIGDTAWMTNSRAWKNIYIEQGGKIIFCANPYIYEESSAVEGQYSYDKTHKQLKLIFKADTSEVAIKQISGNLMVWNTILLGDTVKMELYKVTD